MTNLVTYYEITLLCTILGAQPRPKTYGTRAGTVPWQFYR